MSFSHSSIHHRRRSDRCWWWWSLIVGFHCWLYDVLVVSLIGRQTLQADENLAMFVGRRTQYWRWSTDHACKRTDCTFTATRYMGWQSTWGYTSTTTTTTSLTMVILFVLPVTLIPIVNITLYLVYLLSWFNIKQKENTFGTDLISYNRSILLEVSSCHWQSWISHLL